MVLCVMLSVCCNCVPVRVSLIVVAVRVSLIVVALLHLYTVCFSVGIMENSGGKDKSIDKI